MLWATQLGWAGRAGPRPPQPPRPHLRCAALRPCWSLEPSAPWVEAKACPAWDSPTAPALPLMARLLSTFPRPAQCKR